MPHALCPGVRVPGRLRLRIGVRVRLRVRLQIPAARRRRLGISSVASGIGHRATFLNEV